jgi:putative alpha-1,2-mannosidase
MDETVLLTGSSVTSTSEETRIGGMFSFDAKATKIISRVGISWISVKKARQNVDTEIPVGTTLQKVLQDTKTAWNEEVFSKSPSSRTARKIYSCCTRPYIS